MKLGIRIRSDSDMHDIISRVKHTMYLVNGLIDLSEKSRTSTSTVIKVGLVLNSGSMYSLKVLTNFGYEH